MPVRLTSGFLLAFCLPQSFLSLNVKWIISKRSSFNKFQSVSQLGSTAKLAKGMHETEVSFDLRPQHPTFVCRMPWPQGQGSGRLPRLSGQSYYYVKRKLEQWGEGYHRAAIAPMPEVASKLSPKDIEALASYLSFVR